MGSLTKGKGKSADLKDDNNTGGQLMGDPDQDEGSQGINAPDQVDLTEFLPNIQAPADAGDSKEEKLFFLAALSKEDWYQAMVQWLKDHLVLYFLSSIVIAIGADISIQSPADFVNDFVDDTSSFPDFTMWTSQEAYLPAAFHTQKGFKKVINSLWTPPTTGTHQVAMVLALGLMIQDMMCVVEIEPDQCPPGVLKWVASSVLTVKHLDPLLEMGPVLKRLNER